MASVSSTARDRRGGFSEQKRHPRAPPTRTQRELPRSPRAGARGLPRSAPDPARRAPPDGGGARPRSSSLQAVQRHRLGGREQHGPRGSYAAAAHPRSRRRRRRPSPSDDSSCARRRDAGSRVCGQLRVCSRLLPTRPASADARYRRPFSSGVPGRRPTRRRSGLVTVRPRRSRSPPSRRRRRPPKSSSSSSPAPPLRSSPSRRLAGPPRPRALVDLACSLVPASSRRFLEVDRQYAVRIQVCQHDLDLSVRRFLNRRHRPP